MEKRLLVAGIMLCCFVTLNSYSASARETRIGAEASASPQALGAEASASPRALVASKGGLSKAIFLFETAEIANGSITAWVNAFNRNVTLAGTTPQCIEMRYSGEAQVSSVEAPSYPMQFRALVDGVLAKGGAPFFDVSVPDSYTTAAMNWWVCGLIPGTHNVKIQFGPYFASDTSFVRNRTLIIEYRQ
ncbi:MAG: hypothetical protein PHI97_27770 [Desulfobulbus sp.]|nr:hypothetical protein [Desulfobulbus sp.]